VNVPPRVKVIEGLKKERPMKVKMLLAALALTVAPTLALAQACGVLGHVMTEKVVMSCAEGSMFDADAQRCVPTTG
jgi:hypothetical protein